MSEPSIDFNLLAFTQVYDGKYTVYKELYYDTEEAKNGKYEIRFKYKIREDDVANSVLEDFEGTNYLRVVGRYIKGYISVFGSYKIVDVSYDDAVNVYAGDVIAIDYSVVSKWAEDDQNMIMKASSEVVNDG